MSLENKIEELTIVLSALAVAIGKVLAQTQPAVHVPAAAAKEEPKSTTKAAKKETAIEEGDFEEVVEKPAAKPATKAEKPAAKPATKAEKSAAKPATKAVEEDDDMPEGERDAAYFNSHVRPLCIDLLQTHGDKMKALAKKLDSDRLSNVDPEHWGAVYKQLKKWLAELEEVEADSEEDDF